MEVRKALQPKDIKPYQIFRSDTKDGSEICVCIPDQYNHRMIHANKKGELKFDFMPNNYNWEGTLSILENAEFRFCVKNGQAGYRFILPE